MWFAENEFLKSEIWTTRYKIDVHASIMEDSQEEEDFEDLTEADLVKLERGD